MEQANNGIGCSVQECTFHSGGSNLCTLNKIQVGKVTERAQNKENTVCNSFQGKA